LKSLQSKNGISACCTILNLQLTIKFLQCKEFPLDKESENRMVLGIMYNKFIDEDMPDECENDNEPCGNEMEYFA
jgi:hypothetical protein